MSEDVVYFRYYTIAGALHFPMLKEWEFDKTAKVVWVHLMYSVREWDKLLKSKSLTRKEAKTRDRLDEKNDILGNVLATHYGMSSTYFVLEARRLKEYMP